LAQTKAGVYTPSPESTYYPPPDSVLEFVLVFLGLVVITCGYLQRRMHVKYAILQMIFGLTITIISMPLVIRAAALGHGEYSTIYYFVYLLLIPGLAVSLLGVFQLVQAIKTKFSTK
jgi:hypothetical membrane protein